VIVIVVAVGEVVMVVVVVVIGVEIVVVVVELIDDHVRFGTYHRLDFGHQYCETFFRSLEPYDPK